MGRLPQVAGIAAEPNDPLLDGRRALAKGSDIVLADLLTRRSHGAYSTPLIRLIRAVMAYNYSRMEEKGHNRRDVPKLNLTLSTQERERLQRLARMRGGAKMSRVVADAVVHMLATLELGEAVHYIVPSEQGQPSQHPTGDDDGDPD